MTNAALSSPTRKRKRLRPLGFSLLLYSYKKTSDVFLLQDRSVWVFNIDYLGLGGKIQFIPLPFLGGEKKERGKSQKIYIYISRETRANT